MVNFFQKHEKLIYSAWQKFSLKKHNFYKKLTKQFFQWNQTEIQPKFTWNAEKSKNIRKINADFLLN